jgi:AcrR family transcriptional regulator
VAAEHRRPPDHRQPAGSRGTREQQAAARREQIHETALRLFAAHGFDATSTKQIAREAGIAEGLVFHYFPTKASLLTAILDTRHSFIGALRALLTGAEARPVDEVLHEVATGWLHTLRREQDITVVMFGAAQTNPEVGAALQDLIRAGTGSLAAYLAARVDAGELRRDLPLETAALTFFAPLMIFFLTNRHLPTAEWDARAAAHVDELLSTWLEGGRTDQ